MHVIRRPGDHLYHVRAVNVGIEELIGGAGGGYREQDGLARQWKEVN
ncbi:hypothetical protein [Rossellomorea marisflavi]